MRTLCSLALAAAALAGEFDGTWVYRQDGQILATLTLASREGKVTGRLTQLERVEFNQDGWITAGGPGRFGLNVNRAESTPGRLEMTIDGDRFTMIATGADRATFGLRSIRPWPMERVAAGTKVEMAERLRRPAFPPEIDAMRKRLRDLVKEDQAARTAKERSVEKMDEADRKSLVEVERIFARYGWVTYSLAGREASDDFWLLVQHQELSVQKRMIGAFAKAVEAGDASKRLYAYLHDRVNMYEGKPQRWGTQIKCAGGKPALHPVEDPDGLEARRAELNMPPVAEYLAVPSMVAACAAAK